MFFKQKEERCSVIKETVISKVERTFLNYYSKKQKQRAFMYDQ